MEYPSDLIVQFGTTAAFAEAASAHPLAPVTRSTGETRTLDAAAVYMWKSRDFVPFMWQPVVSALHGQGRGTAA